jgi:hypothetical protein
MILQSTIAKKVMQKRIALTNSVKISSSCGDPVFIRTSALASRAAHLSTTRAWLLSFQPIVSSLSPVPTTFTTALLAWNTQKPEIRDEDQDNDYRSPEHLPLCFPHLPSHPPSLHFVLGFIYTGTLIFSNRTYDLDTAFHIMRSATYISLTSLYDEVQARIVQEMMHGLFHAYVEFAEYERITGGKWGVAGCRCRQCARRMPRVIEFALLDDVKNELLQRGARRGLVGMFGEGWCTQSLRSWTRRSEKLRSKASQRETPHLTYSRYYSQPSLR